MEQVTAYKAFNGRLFDTEDKCIAYEKKLSQYPKIVHDVERVEYILDNGEKSNVDIIKHTISTQKKPSSQKEIEVYYIAGNYKLTATSDYHISNLTTENLYKYYEMVDRAVIRKIVLGEEINDETLSEIREKYHQMDIFSRMEYNTLVEGKKWEMQDSRWKSGTIKPYIFTIEKIN